MTSEATLNLKTQTPYDIIVLDANALEKGTIMQLSGASTIGRTGQATTSTSFNVPFAGITRREKIADTGRTRVAVYDEGIFTMYATPSPIAQGDVVMISGANLIASVNHWALSAAAASVGRAGFGKALASTTGSTAIQVRVGR